MPVIAPKQKVINAENIREFQGEYWPKPRHIVLCRDLQSVPLEVIRPVAQDVAEHVETVEMEAYGGSANNRPTNLLLVSCICSARATQLKNLTIVFRRSFSVNSFGAEILSALLTAPSVEELTLESVGFQSPKNVQEYFAATRTLKTLGLFCCSVATNHRVATAFRQGLGRNQSLTKISFRPSGDSPFLDDVLLGIAQNQRVQELRLCLYFLGSPLDKTLLGLRGLVAGTTSIRKMCLESIDATEMLIDVFVGLTTNSSIQEIEIECRGTDVGNASMDAKLEGVIRECFARNQTLEVYEMRALAKLGPLVRVALANSLSQAGSLRFFCANGNAVSPSVLQHVARVQSVSLCRERDDPDWDWELLSRSIEIDQAECMLQVLDLSSNKLTAQNLETFLPSLLSHISELSVVECGITIESVPVLCDLIRNAGRLRKLNLGSNPVGAEGASSILQAVSTSMSLEHLDAGGLRTIRVNDDDPGIVNINECHDSLRMLLVAADSRLVFLNLAHHCEPLGLDAIRSVTAGLRVNTTIKTIKLPCLELAFIHFLAEALSVNHSLKSLEVVSGVCVTRNNFGGGGGVLKELVAEEEESAISFIGMMPRMQSLVCIKHLFDFKTSEQLNQALVAALKENTVLKEIHGLAKNHADHVCNNETVQFLLELNRLGRHHYLAACESNPVKVGILPHLFGRMAEPEYPSHLYYFLRRTSPDLMVGQGSSTGRRRRRTTASPG